eukprot:655340-Rhodomonas_salina.1
MIYPAPFPPPSSVPNLDAVIALPPCPPAPASPSTRTVCLRWPLLHIRSDALHPLHSTTPPPCPPTIPHAHDSCCKPLPDAPTLCLSY